MQLAVLQISSSFEMGGSTSEAHQLPEDRPQDVNVYLNWIYTRHIFLDPEAIEDSTDWDQIHRDIVRAYALGDKFLDKDFQDAICDTYARILEMARSEGGVAQAPTAEMRVLLYDMTIPGAKLPKLLVHSTTKVTDPTVSRDNDHHDFLLDLVREFTQRNAETAAAAAGRCAFHEHSPGKEHCYRTKYCTNTEFVHK